MHVHDDSQNLRLRFSFLFVISKANSFLEFAFFIELGIVGAAKPLRSNAAIAEPRKARPPLVGGNAPKNVFYRSYIYEENRH